MLTCVRSSAVQCCFRNTFNNNTLLGTVFQNKIEKVLEEKGLLFRGKKKNRLHSCCSRRVNAGRRGKRDSTKKEGKKQQVLLLLLLQYIETKKIKKRLTRFS